MNEKPDASPALSHPKLAITRKVSASYRECALEFNSRTEINVDLAQEQHHEYVSALRRVGLEVSVLPSIDAFPDGCFVEDTAVVLDNTAMITRMGADSRNGEQDEVADRLAAKLPITVMQSPARLDGGDVLKIDRNLLVGKSRRTNDAGIDFLSQFALSQGYKVRPVPVPDYLHLKTAITYLGDNTCIATPRMANLARTILEEIHCSLMVVPEDCEYAANVLRLCDTVLLPSGFPRVSEAVRSMGLQVQELNLSEFQKGEGGVTCLSILL